jgi:hypothetical protein
MYSSYSFMTSALDGVSGQRHAPATIHPRRKDSLPIGQEAGWTPEPPALASAGIEPRSPGRLVGSHTRYPGPRRNCKRLQDRWGSNLTYFFFVPEK